MADAIIKINCGCGCGCDDSFNIQFWFEEFDDWCIFSSQASVFYLKQTSFFQVWKARIKAAWAMLRGKEYCLHEVCLTKEQYNNLVDEMIKYREKTNVCSVSM